LHVLYLLHTICREYHQNLPRESNPVAPKTPESMEKDQKQNNTPHPNKKKHEQKPAKPQKPQKPVEAKTTSQQNITLPDNKINKNTLIDSKSNDKKITINRLAVTENNEVVVDAIPLKANQFAAVGGHRSK